MGVTMCLSDITAEICGAFRFLRAKWRCRSIVLTFLLALGILRERGLNASSSSSSLSLLTPRRRYRERSNVAVTLGAVAVVVVVVVVVAMVPIPSSLSRAAAFYTQ